MAVLPMQRITICALTRDRKKILESLQRRGAIEIDETVSEDSIFHKTDVAAAETILKKNAAAAKEALEVLNTYVPEKRPLLSMLAGRTELPARTYDQFYAKHDELSSSANRICALPKQIAERKAEILRLKAQREILAPWAALDIPMNFSGTKHTACFIGTLPNAWTPDALYERLAMQMPLSAEIISVSREQTCVFVLCEKEQAGSTADTLRHLGFSLAPSSGKAPADELRELENLIREAELAAARLSEQIASYAPLRGDLRLLSDFETMRAEKYDVIGRLVQSKNTFVLTGYIPEKDRALLESELNANFELAIDFECPAEEEEPPVLLKNNAFSRPIEGILESYSLPGKGEIDPTVPMSVFFYILFGLLFCDAGYGAIMIIVCGFCLYRYRHTLEDNWRNTLKLYLFCGISTLFWGAVFGSYFGDIVDVVSATFFSHKISIPPILFFQIEEPMRTLIFCMLMGIIHLFFGLGLKGYQCILRKDYKSLLFDVILWYILLTGSVMKLLTTKMFSDIFAFRLFLPALASSVVGVLTVGAAIGIILTNGRESRNWFKRLLKGLYAFYGITGYLGDVLSYSRILALGLASGVISTVVNKMAVMTAKGPLGVIPFTMVVLLGHGLNFGISIIGAYVHTTRLHYVEFFGKFYGGGGRKFTPFSVKTKYYKFREE